MRLRAAAGISTRAVILAIAIVAAIIATILVRPRPANRGAVIPSTATALTTTTIPATVPATLPSPRAFLDVIRASYPGYPTTQPLDERLELRDAAAFVLTDPVYLCPRADLWITRADADALPVVLARAYNERVHVLPTKVLFVHWAPNENGDWLPHLIVRTAAGFELLIPPPPAPPVEGHRRPIRSSDPIDPKHVELPKRPYDFSRAFSWNDSIVVPTTTGVSILRLDFGRITDSYQELIPESQILNLKSEIPKPQLLLDPRGLLTWIPPSGSFPGSRGAFRFLDKKWTPLGPDQSWPASIIHLIPLLDGSVIQILPTTTADQVELKLTTLDTPTIDPARIQSLVDDLSDPDEKKRSSAFDELTRYGPGLWPILEKLLADQSPEARIRLQQLLQNKLEPKLGSFTLVNNQLRLISRFPGGGVLFFAPAGVTLATESDKVETIAPAHLAILPGHRVTLVSKRLTTDFNPAAQQLVFQNNEWILADDVYGPRRFTGVSLDPILPKSLIKYRHFAGKDHAGRWLFREAQLGTGDRELGTLIVDPSLPDATPRLPVWTYNVPPSGTVGWDAKGWPVIKSGTAFAIERAGFRPLKPTEKIFTRADEGSAPATSSATSLLITSDGTYFDGQTSLTLITPKGDRIDWPLPPTAIGRLRPTLIQADNRLFLYNEPGRVLRLRRNPSTSAEPFTLEATFTRKIPNADRPSRIWLDPAGRIVIATTNRLSLLFPQGRIPRETALLIPASELDTPAD